MFLVMMSMIFYIDIVVGYGVAGVICYVVGYGVGWNFIICVLVLFL